MRVYVNVGCVVLIMDFGSFSLDWGSNYCIIRDFDFANKDELLSIVKCEFLANWFGSLCV